eukprot:TRINITY_DN8336_c0_g1_i2.p1 TRINITY_DN8336_c0_g1~~TRINITY_DN8336_c0_g1_i2.p1  ORF type:complete len:435 (+),score=44.98 TRINITY_DN8336_c0_g1_i2:91-1395(+)
MEENEPVWQSPIQSIPSSLEESREREGHAHSHSTDLAIGSLVATTDEPHVGVATPTTRSQGSISTRTQQKRISHEKPKLEMCRISYLWRQEGYGALPDDIKDFVLRGGKTSTVDTYASGWKKFASWFNEQKDLQHGTISPHVLVKFLWDLFAETKKDKPRYCTSTIRNIKTAVSMTAPLWQGKPLGESSLVKRILHNFEVRRPTKAAYEDTYDIDIVLNYVRDKLSSRNEEKIVRERLILLLRIAGLMRTSDIGYIMFDSIKISETEVTGRFSALKNQKIGSSLNWSLSANPDFPSWCPRTAMKDYVRITKNSVRNGNRLLVSLDHKKEIMDDTIAGIVRRSLENAGIDIKKFKPHSTRSAAATKAIDKGADVRDVMRCGRWRSEEVFNAFYNRSRMKDLVKLLLRPEREEEDRVRTIEIMSDPEEESDQNENL